MNSHVQHYKRPAERPFTKDQRDSTTILFGGLTYNHDYLIEGALQGMGYNAKYLPVPDNHSLSVGKKYGNRGQCNPTYYTVGNLIKYLQNLNASGTEKIDDKYVFLTAGSCGPCRFGMYEAEYRKALRDAGFPDFRGLLFQQSGDMNQGKERGRDILYSALKERKPLRSILKKINQIFSEIKVDYSRIKPKVKLTGEFWAMTTEGDGNYMLQRWLESEGAEVVTEPVSNWVSFIFWEHAERAKERRKVKKGAYKTILGLKAASLLFHYYYASYRSALKFRPDALSSQDKIAEYAKNYYNPAYQAEKDTWRS